MGDSEKITGVPIDDEALDKVAGGIMITPDTVKDVRIVGQPLDDFYEMCEVIQSTLDRQDIPNNNHTIHSDPNKTVKDYMKEGINIKNSFNNRK